MKNTKICFLIILATVMAGCGARTQKSAFDPTVRYSQQIIDSCIYQYRANTTPVAFKQFDAEGNLLADHAYGKDRLDYVPGLVAKALIEAVDYYQNEEFAAGWLYSIQAYGNEFYDDVPTDGGSLDDLNAVKLYFGLRELTQAGSRFADSATAAHCTEAISRARAGLAAHHQQYCIAEDHTERAAHGGWWHKSNYINQMWCDGQYMGPALLAQIVAGGDGTITGSADADWQIIVRQFQIAWHYLWDADKQLLWHAFSADGNAANDITHAETWAQPDALHSATYWGRAEGWYFMALVDVLEQMQKAGRVETEAYGELRNQLQAVADGLINRQDASSGCWYQLLCEDSTFVADSYNGQAVEPKANYLESSCTFLFAAAYLKGARLGLFADNDQMRMVGKKAYEGAISRFWNGHELLDCCASAGLGGKGKGYAAGGAKYRDGSKAYYLQGPDVARVTTYTEGKVLGAAIMAAIEYERGSGKW